MQIYNAGMSLRSNELRSYQEIIREWIDYFIYRENKRPALVYVGFKSDSECEHDDYCVFNPGYSTYEELILIMLSADDEDLNWGALIFPENKPQWHRVVL